VSKHAVQTLAARSISLPIDPEILVIEVALFEKVCLITIAPLPDQIADDGSRKPKKRLNRVFACAVDVLVKKRELYR
jgi:hypothetical protein